MSFASAHWKKDPELLENGGSPVGIFTGIAVNRVDPSVYRFCVSRSARGWAPGYGWSLLATAIWMTGVPEPTGSGTTVTCPPTND